MTSLRAETEATLAMAATLWAPPPSLSPSEWAEAEFKLSVEESANPGSYSLRDCEYLREVLDAANDPEVPEIVIAKAAQTRYTTALIALIGYSAAHDPSRVLAGFPTQDDGEIFSKDRLTPNIHATAALRNIIKSAKSRSSSDTIRHKRFPGGALKIVGANSARGLASWPSPRVFLDEVDGYPASAGKEGDPISLVRQRNKTWGARRKLIIGSTPTIEGKSVVVREYMTSDRREFCVPCHDCGGLVIPRFFRPSDGGHNDGLILPHGALYSYVDWDKTSKGLAVPETAHMPCPHCGTVWDDEHRLSNIRRGRWVPTAPFAGRRGYWLRGLLSPNVTMPELAARWSDARDDEQRKVFYNTDLGETWRISGEAVEPENLFARREARAYGDVPMGVLFLTAGVDVQRDRIEAYVWGWGRDRRSWLVDFRVFRGKPTQPEVWKELDELLLETWRHESGVDMRLVRLGIDTGDGLFTSEVYRWCWRQGSRVVMPVKGASRQERMDASVPVRMSEPVSLAAGGRRKRSDLRVALIATGVFKSELMGSLRLALDDDGSAPSGWVSLPRSADMDVCQQLVAEELVLAPKKTGPAVYEWRKRQGRNEALDCFVYARAAAWMLGIDRWSESKWRDAEAALGLMDRPAPKAAPEIPLTPVATPEAASAKPAPPARKRSGGWLGGTRGNWLGR